MEAPQGPSYDLAEIQAKVAAGFYVVTMGSLEGAGELRLDRKDIEASAHGDSVAHWEGDTLVIDATNFNEDTWLGDNGLFHSAKLRVTERLRRTGDTMTWEATVEDPVVLTEPWKMTPRTLTLLKGVEIEEAAFCEDRDLSRMKDLTHHGNTR